MNLFLTIPLEVSWKIILRRLRPVIEEPSILNVTGVGNLVQGAIAFLPLHHPRIWGPQYASGDGPQAYGVERIIRHFSSDQISSRDASSSFIPKILF